MFFLNTNMELGNNICNEMGRSFLSSISIYQISFLPLPKGAKRKIDSKLRDIFWKGIDDKKKLALITWDNICKPKDKGGLGIKNINWKNEVLGVK